MGHIRIKVINGPNLNMLGVRKVDVYGLESLEAIRLRLIEVSEQLKVELSFFQSNHEGEIIDEIQSCYKDFDGILINPGAYTHYSIAIRDALEAVAIPAIEVHITNIFSREEFRSHSVISPVCIGTIAGLGAHGYELALRGLTERLRR